MMPLSSTRLRIAVFLLLFARNWTIALGFGIAHRPCRLCSGNRIACHFGYFNSFLSAHNDETSSEPAKNDVLHRIRDCTYSELNQVADVIIAAFYSNSTNPWRQLYRMGELNRVQQAYPYKKSDHRMFVAIVQTDNALRDEKIVAFVDVDDRPVQPRFPSPYKENPRPYLSDLCVHPDFHRKGIARAMVKECEKFCREDLRKTELFIRVEQTNQPALLMYESMGYAKMDDPDNGLIILLRKSLVDDESEVVCTEDVDRLVEQQYEIHT